MRAPPTIHLLLAAYTSGLVAALAWRPCGAAALALLGATGLWALVWVGGPRERSPTRFAVPAGLAVTAPPPAAPPRAARPAPPWRLWLPCSAVLGLAPLLLVSGLTVGAARLDAQAHSRLTPFVGRTVALRATALTLPKLSGRRLTLDVEVTAVAGARSPSALLTWRSAGRGARLHLARAAGRGHAAAAAGGPGRSPAGGQARRLRLRALPRAARRARRARRAARLRCV